MEEIIKECDNCKYVMTDTESFPCNRCTRNSVDKWEPISKQTNADKIRSMTDEKLAEFLDNMCLVKAGLHCEECNNPLNCDVCYLDWLQSEAE